MAVCAAMLGNLYVVRNGGWSVVVFSSAGAVLFRIALTFRCPSNLEFGGSDGRTLYIVGRCTDLYTWTIKVLVAMCSAYKAVLTCEAQCIYGASSGAMTRIHMCTRCQCRATVDCWCCASCAHALKRITSSVVLPWHTSYSLALVTFHDAAASH
jgi:SMP-30/Gluconolactonase/LRE-like region